MPLRPQEPLTQELIKAYCQFVPFVEITHVQKHDFRPTRNDPNRYRFTVNFGGRFIIHDYGWRIQGRNHWWWTGNCKGRLLNGTDDEVFSTAIKYLLDKHRDEMMAAAVQHSSQQTWRVDTQRILAQLEAEQPIRCPNTQEMAL